RKTRSPRKSTWKFNLNLTHREKVKVNEKIRDLGNVTHIESFKNKITVKYLKKNNLRDWLHVVASEKETYELCYFQISQDEDESDYED
ncbi:hypothetical protein FD754_020027, partial [Muntiacus muntjak]